MPTLEEVQKFFDSLKKEGIIFVSDKIPVPGVDISGVPVCKATSDKFKLEASPYNPPCRTWDEEKNLAFNPAGRILHGSSIGLFKRVYTIDGNYPHKLGPQKIDPFIFAQLCSGCFWHIDKHNSDNNRYFRTQRKQGLTDLNNTTIPVSCTVFWTYSTEHLNRSQYGEYNARNPYKVLAISESVSSNNVSHKYYLTPIDEYGTYYVGLTAEGPKIHTAMEWKYIINKLPLPKENKCTECENLQLINTKANNDLLKINQELKRISEIVSKKQSDLDQMSSDLQRLESEKLSLTSELRKLSDDYQSSLETIEVLQTEINELKLNTVYSIQDYVDQSILDKIYQLQNKSDKLDCYTCCSCLEEVNQIIPLKCIHELCKNCYQKSEDKVCIVCQKPFETVTIHKLIAVITKINLNNIGIFYLPPINYSDYEMFNIGNKNDVQRFLSACQNINDQHYSVVVNGNILDDWHKFNVVRKLDIIVC
jgi:archaellum component FlaC